MDNQRLIIWGIFAVMAYLTWQTWQQDYAPQPVPQTAGTDVPEPVDANADVDVLPQIDTAGEDLPSVGATSDPVDVSDAVDDTAVIVVTTDVARYEINTRGGTLQGASMLQYPVEKDEPDQLITLLSTAAGDVGLIRSWVRADEGQVAAGPGAVYASAETTYELGDAAELVVPLSWTDASGITVEKRFVFTPGNYAIRLEQTITNGSATVWRGDQITQLRRRSYEQERSMFDVDSYSFDGPQIYNGEKAEKLDRDDLLESATPLTVTTNDGWYASIQHHFLSAIIPEAGKTNLFQIQVSGNTLTTSVIEEKQSIAPGASGTFNRTLFVGPKLQAQLKEHHEELALSVDYGWLVILSQPMFWLLAWLHTFLGNWGWSIIGVTILIKLAFYKLTESSGRSMAKMRELQPRMKQLQDRYKDDRPALSQAMMDLYKREKVNPAAGCLPILIQMPFFLSFYWVLVESVEMRQAPFALWLTDLSTRDPYFILPLIMGAAMLVQQRLNPAPADPVQARVMQIMPIMFTAFFAFFPSGLVLYWVTNTLLSIAQQWKINKVVHAEATEKKGSHKKGKKDKKDKKD